MTSDSLRIQVSSHRLDVHQSRTGNNRCACKNSITNLLEDGTRFAGEHRFVNFEARYLEDFTVSGNLVTQTELDDVVKNDIVDIDLFSKAISTYLCPGRIDYCKIV